MIIYTKDRHETLSWAQSVQYSFTPSLKWYHLTLGSHPYFLFVHRILFNPIKSNGYVTPDLSLNFLRSAYIVHFFCFVWISERQRLFRLQHWLTITNKEQHVYCAVRTNSWNKIQVSFRYSIAEIHTKIHCFSSRIGSPHKKKSAEETNAQLAEQLFLY